MAQRPSLGDYITVLRTSVPKMATELKELASAEMKPMAKNGGIGAAGIIVALVFAFVMLEIVLLAAGFGLSIIFAEPLDRNPVTALALGFTVEAVLFLILTAVVGIIGWRHLKKVKAPQATIAEAKASFSAIATAIEKGVDDAGTRQIPAGATEFIGTSTQPSRRDRGWTHN